MEDIHRFIQEDVGEGDVTSETLFKSERGKATIYAREPCVVAGVKEARAVFRALGLKVTTLVKDGDEVVANMAVLVVDGGVVNILKGERLALNFLMRMSGIATETRMLVRMCETTGAMVLVAGTRKTVPGFRKYDKRAIELGGGWSHRAGLFDGILIKDNHLRLVSIEDAVKRGKSTGRDVEIEVGNIDEAVKAALAGADTIMLDNMSPADVKETSKMLRKSFPKIKIEVSGGVTPENIERYAPYADVISLGYLTHSIKAKNFSMDMEPPTQPTNQPKQG